MFITIAGMQGSGKSTICNLICQKYGYEKVYAGGIMRDIAKERGVNIRELNEMSESDSALDIEIDTRTQKYAKALLGRNVIFDSRMAWHFAPNSVKVYITVDEQVAAQRIYNDKRGDEDTYNSVEMTLAEVIKRKHSENKRYKEFYKVDNLDMSNYDLVIDSTHRTPDEMVEIIMSYVKKSQ